MTRKLSTGPLNLDISSSPFYRYIHQNITLPNLRLPLPNPRRHHRLRKGFSLRLNPALPVVPDQQEGYYQESLQPSIRDANNPGKHYFEEGEGVVDGGGAIIGVSVIFGWDVGENGSVLDVAHDCDCTVLATISVMPEFRGRGIASQLLGHGLDELVDKDGLEYYLETSPNLHRRYGFQDRGTISMMGGDYEIVGMVRPGSLSKA